MQPRHLSTHSPLTRSAPQLSSSRFAPIALTLPDISRQTYTFTIEGDKHGLAQVADALVGLNVMGRQHWTGRLDKSCEKALSDLCDTVRPDPLFPLKLHFTDDARELGDTDDMLRRRGRPVSQVGALTLLMKRYPVAILIGHTLRALEKEHETLGQTVLYALDQGLDRSCRGLTSRAGYGWAQGTYWGGELDESMRLEELQYEYPNGTPIETIRQETELFTKADFDRNFPGWVGSGPIQHLPLEKVERLRWNPKHRKIQKALIDLMRGLRRISRKDTSWDCFEYASWDICPFLLKWEDKDILGQIWDDTMQPHWESGETNMEVNAAFAYSDRPSFISAIRHLRNYLTMMQLTENLIKTIGKEY